MFVVRLVVGQIEDLQIYCCYGVTEENGKLVPDPSGCQQKIHLGMCCQVSGRGLTDLLLLWRHRGEW